MLAALIHGALICTAYAQPAFTGAGEIVVSDSPEGGPTSIAIRDDGVCIVSGGGKTTWVHPDLTIGLRTNIGIWLPSPDFRVAIDQERWGKLGLGSTVRQTPNGFEGAYDYLFTFYTQAHDDSSRSLFGMAINSNSNAGYEHDGYATRLRAVRLANCTILSANWQTSGFTNGWCVSTAGSALFALRRQPRELKQLSSLSCDQQGPFPMRNVYQSLVSISAASDTSFLALFRTHLSQASKGSSDPYLLTLVHLSAAGDTVHPPVPLDTIPGEVVDLSDQIVALPGENVAHFRSHFPGDSLFAQLYSRDGGKLTPEIFVASNLKRNSYHTLTLMPRSFAQWLDFDVAQLSGGRSVLVWTETGAGTSENVLVGLLDGNMRWMGQPKRLNSVSTGVHHSPSVAVMGDTIHVVWLDTRSGESMTYFRKFTPDQLTSAETTPGAGEPELAQNYPNPFSTATSIRCSLASHRRVSLRMFDLLGREVRMIFEGELGAGSHTLSVRGDGLPNGIYFYRLTAGNSSMTKVAILQR